MGPYLLWPSCAFTTAIEGDGIPPSSRASFRFSSVRLCTATSSFVRSTSTGALSWNRTVFFTGSSVLLLSSEVCAILCSGVSGNLLLESSDSTWVPPEASPEPFGNLLLESSDSARVPPEGSVKPSRRLLPESSDSMWVRERVLLFAGRIPTTS